MGARKYRRLTAPERQALWVRFKAGDSLTTIAEALGRQRGTLQNEVRARGGIVPALRRRAAHVLSSGEREMISRGMAAGESVRTIARGLHRAPSTISREIQRNGGRAGYRAVAADRRAWRRAERPKACRLALSSRLRREVATKLQLQWSPAQIAGWLFRTYPDDPAMRVSHETIYRTLYVQTRGALKKELTLHLRTQRVHRYSRNAKQAMQGPGQIAGAVSITERPASVEDRAVPGHWEGDLLVGSDHTQIATLVERASRYVHLVRVTSKETAVVVAALIREVQRLPVGLMQTLTWDRGLEMAHHRRFSMATDVQVYFCDPRSPWQRGSNENTNGLLRQYFPRGTDFSRISQSYLNSIALRLNQRPLKTLGFETPADKLQEVLH